MRVYSSVPGRVSPSAVFSQAAHHCRTVFAFPDALACTAAMQGFYDNFTITSKTVQAVRLIEDDKRQKREAEETRLAEEAKKESERKDIVEQVRDAARKHRILGPVILVSIILGATVTVMNQLVSLFQNLGVISKP